MAESSPPRHSSSKFYSHLRARCVGFVAVEAVAGVAGAVEAVVVVVDAMRGSVLPPSNLRLRLRRSWCCCCCCCWPWDRAGADVAGAAAAEACAERLAEAAAVPRMRPELGSGL